MSETITENLVEQGTDTVEQNQGKSFTQEEVNKLVAQRVDRERNKYDKKYSGIDVEHYDKLVSQEAKKLLNEKKARGEFDSILKDTVTKKDAVISNLEQELKNIKVNGALLSSASTNKAVNADQVVALLQSQVKLHDGHVEIIDGNNQPRYTESGDLMQVDDLVSEFLQTNPHFVQAGPKGSGTTNAISNNAHGVVDLDTLDMTNPLDRQKYKDAKANGLI
jgi:hypothetical protein